MTGPSGAAAPDAHTTAAPDGRARPDVSVLIATRNRAAPLERALRSLALQELGGLSWEVVVVDNGSTDDTPARLVDFPHTLPLVRLAEPVAGKNRALNRALRAARGALVVFTDDDVVADPRWLRALVDAAARWPDVNIFGGAIRPRFPPGTPAWLTHPTFRHTRWAFSGYHPRADEGYTPETPLGPNMAIRAHLLDPDTFDESMGPRGVSYAMGSEVELLLRLRRDGELFVFVPDAVVEHVLPPEHVTRRNLMTRAFRCGRGNARLFATTPTFPFFGISLYQWQRLLAALARLPVALLSSQAARWTAVMELHQVRGDITERLRILAASRAVPPGEGVERWRFFPTLPAVSAAFKRRGPLRLLAAPLALATRPLVQLRGCHLFEAPLEPAIGHAAPDGLVIEMHRGPGASARARRLICPLDVVGPEVVADRLARGDAVAVAVHGDRAIGYAWSTPRDLDLAEVGRRVRLAPTEVAGYDGYVLAGWRGRRVLAALDAAQMAAAASDGRSRQVTHAMTGNRASIRAMEAMGKRRVLTLYQVVLPLLGREVSWIRERAPGSRDRLRPGRDEGDGAPVTAVG